MINDINIRHTFRKPSVIAFLKIYSMFEKFYLLFKVDFQYGMGLLFWLNLWQFVFKGHNDTMEQIITDPLGNRKLHLAFEIQSHLKTVDCYLHLRLG